MEKASLIEVKWLLNNDSYIFGPGWTNEESQEKFKKNVVESLTQCNFDRVYLDQHDTYKFTRGEELVICGPIQVQAFLTDMSIVEIKFSLKRNGIEILEESLDCSEEYYYYSKSEFVDKLEENNNVISDTLLENFYCENDEYIESNKLESILQETYVGFNYVYKGTSLADWYSTVAYDVKEEIFDELVAENKIEKIYDESENVIGYRKAKNL